MVDLSALAYALRKLCAAQGINFPIGHAQQFIAAALGHGTLAALQASSDADLLPAADYLVIDTSLLHTRAAALGIAASADLLGPVATVFTDAFQATIHASADSFVDSLQEYVDDRVVNDNEVAGQLAMTNGGLDEIYMPLDLWETLDLDDDEHLSSSVVGHVSVEQYPEKVYWGHRVDVEATLTVARLGRRLFAEPQLRVLRAKLQWFGEDDKEGDELAESREPQVPIAQALARVLGIAEADAENLEYEVLVNASDDGLQYDIVLQFGQTESPALREKIRVNHPNLSVRVPADFFEGVSPPDLR